MRSNLMGLILIFVFFTPLAAISAEESGNVRRTALQTVTLDVQKMECPLCEITIRKALEKVNGVKAAKVDYGTKTASIVFDSGTTNIDALTRAATDAGYPSTLKPE